MQERESIHRREPLLPPWLLCRANSNRNGNNQRGTGFRDNSRGQGKKWRGNHTSMWKLPTDSSRLYAGMHGNHPNTEGCNENESRTPSSIRLLHRTMKNPQGSNELQPGDIVKSALWRRLPCELQR